MATLTAEELAIRKAQVAALRDALASGVLQVSMQWGDRSEARTYRSTADLQTQLTRLEAEIAEAEGTAIRPRTWGVYSRKGF